MAKKKTKKETLVFGQLIQKYGVVGLIAIGLFYMVTAFWNSSAKVNVDAKQYTQKETGRDSINIMGEGNTLTYVKPPTDFENDQEKVWSDAWTPFDGFVTRFNREDFAASRQLLDKFMKKDLQFSEEKLRSFKETIVKGNLVILDMKRDNAITADSEYRLKRGFTFTLRYIDKRTNKEVKEKWRGTSIIYLQEDNYWQIGALTCVDKACANNFLLQ